MTDDNVVAVTLVAPRRAIIGMKVADNRTDVQRLVDEVCVRLGAIKDGEPHYRGLSQAIGLSPMTIPNMLERGDVMPAWDTLFTLSDKTDVPMIEWLLALDVVKRDELARALDVRRPPRTLSEGQRQALEFFANWPEVEVRDLLRWLREAPFAHGDRPGAAPGP